MNKWLSSELSFLEKNYRIIPKKELAVYLSRHSLNSIYLKAEELGLTKKHRDKKEYDFPKYRGMTIKEQALAMGLSYSSVYRNFRKNMIYNKNLGLV